MQWLSYSFVSNVHTRVVHIRSAYAIIEVKRTFYWNWKQFYSTYRNQNENDILNEKIRDQIWTEDMKYFMNINNLVCKYT